VHRAAPWDDWWLFESRSEIAEGGRALWQRRIFDRGGAAIATVQQEGLIRLPPERGD
jgi:acyl-CoA thioesterase